MQAYRCKTSKTFVKEVSYIFAGEIASKKGVGGMKKNFLQ
jgi:hypothetical protein